MAHVYSFISMINFYGEWWLKVKFINMCTNEDISTRILSTYIRYECYRSCISKVKGMDTSIHLMSVVKCDIVMATSPNE